jgi:hypothetical protein
MQSEDVCERRPHDIHRSQVHRPDEDSDEECRGEEEHRSE